MIYSVDGQEGKEERRSDLPTRSSWNIGTHRSYEGITAERGERRREMRREKREKKISKIQQEPDTNTDYSR